MRWEVPWESVLKYRPFFWTVAAELTMLYLITTSSRRDMAIDVSG